MIDVPYELLDRHDKAGPRYTSYPTVPVWSAEFGDADYRAALEGLASRPGEELSVYLHLPFCAKRCHYCGCNAEQACGREAVDLYLDRVEQELALVVGIVGTGRRVVQMHWGGGTPNYLDAKQLRRAVGLMRAAFDLAPDAELSLETDPRIGTPEQAALLRELGFDRISLGVQDFDAGVQEAIGRIQPESRTRRFYTACREAGFEGVNLDLVYGLPGQTMETFDRTLDIVLELDPDRLACFSYAHVPWVRPNQEKVDTSRMPGPHLKFDLFRRAIGRLGDAGYDWIGIDHFARRDDELAVALRERRLHRNFMGYTTHPELRMLAFGMSGIGDLGDTFAQNDAQLDRYQETVAAGRLPIVRGHRLSEDDRLRRLAILNLMCNLELPFELSRPAFGVRFDEALAPELARMQPYVDEGFVVRDDDRIRITELGRYFVRNVCMELDAYLGSTGGKPLFSRTI